MALLSSSSIFRVCLAAYLAAVVQGAASVVRDQGHVLAEIGAHHITAHELVVEKNGPSLMRRDSTKLDNADTPANVGRRPPVACQAWYETAVRDSNASAFYPCNEVVGTVLHGYGPACGQPGWDRFGDPCDVNGHILGSPGFASTDLFDCGVSDDHSTSLVGDHPIHFQGAQYMSLKHAGALDSDQSGYAEKTIEFWMKPTSCDATPASVLRAGHVDYNGLNIYLKSVTAADNSTKCHLHMFAWNHVGDNEGHQVFGLYDDTHNVNAVPLSCEVEVDNVYYVSFVFQQQSVGSHYVGYIKKPGSGTVEECGHVGGLEIDSKFGDISEGNQVITIGGSDGKTRTSASEETDSGYFQGYIQWVAFYNHALSELDMNRHLDAAAGKNKPPHHNSTVASG
jgi:hypothetical protein